MRDTHTAAVRRALQNVEPGPARDWLYRLLTQGEGGRLPSRDERRSAGGARKNAECKNSK